MRKIYNSNPNKFLSTHYIRGEEREHDTLQRSGCRLRSVYDNFYTSYNQV